MSRETRLLFITILISLVTLWVLARIRFPDRPATPNPVSPLLTQLANRPRFEELAVEVAELQTRLLPSLLTLELESPHPPGGQSAVAGEVVAALRIRDDVVVTLLETASGAVSAQRLGNLSILARDPALGLAVVRVAATPAPVLTLWSPQRMQSPRYLIVSDVSRRGTSLRPVFTGSLDSVASPKWSGSIWTTPAHADLTTGAFVFTIGGSLVGLVIEHEGRPAIFPAEAVIRLAERLLREGSREGGWLGVEVQELTPEIGSVVGTNGGVVISWVDPRSAAAGKLSVTDVIEMIGDEVLTTPEHWEARIAGLAAGEPVVLRVRRRGEVREVQLSAEAAVQTQIKARPLGLTMRAVRGIGVEVVRVDPGSAAARAGIETGDVITLIGETEKPTAAQVARVFQTAPEDRPLLVGVSRGDRHRVLALGKR